MVRYFLFLILFFLIGCKKSQVQTVHPVPVSAVRVQAQTIPADFEFVGVAESSHIVELRARVEGYLQSINYPEGGMVHIDELMFVLDQRPFIAEVDRAKGVLDRQKALLWNAQQTKARMVPLYQQNAISQRDLDNAIAEELAAEANVVSAEADLYKAQLNLGFASLNSPVNGVASQAKYREGALISPGDQNLLTTIYVVDPIWVNFAVSDQDLLKMRQDQLQGLIVLPKNNEFQVEAVLSDGTILPAEGHIDFTNPAIQQSTGTMLIRGILPNPQTYLRPGQFVRVIVKGAHYPNAIVVPQEAVIQGEKGTFVYVVEGGKAVERDVSPGDWYKNYWIINQGLKSGDVVIGQGVNKVQNGSLVTIQTMLPSLP